MPSTGLEGVPPDSISSSHHHHTFKASPEGSDIYVFDANDQNSNNHPLYFTHSHSFERHITTTTKPRLRIVSISSRRSIHPLSITESTFRILLHLYQIDSTFFDLALAFGGKPTSADAGRGVMHTRLRLDGIMDTHYLLTYPEYEPGKPNGPGWTFRQVAVFQRVDPKNSENLWIVLNARPKSKLQQALEHFAASLAENYNPLVDWYMVPRTILKEYLRNWRFYIADHLGTEVENTRKLVYDMRSFDSYVDESQIRDVIKPQSLGDQAASLAARLTVALQTVHQLTRLNELLHPPKPGLPPGFNYHTVADELTNYEADLTATLQGLRVLENEVQGIANTLSIAVNLKVNSQMLKLGTESFDDSSTVKSMTLVTLIYLPASFVSSILGMNLFDFDGGGKGSFTISKQFWIFIVLAVPLTLLTLASWYVVARRARKARERKTKQQGDSGAR